MTENYISLKVLHVRGDWMVVKAVDDGGFDFMVAGLTLVRVVQPDHDNETYSVDDVLVVDTDDVEELEYGNNTLHFVKAENVYAIQGSDDEPVEDEDE